MTTECDFLKIYNDYYQKILKYLSRFVGPFEAEDVAQEVFNTINHNIAKIREKSKLSTWIYRIATNTAIDRLRSGGYKQSTANTAFEEAHHPESENDSNALPHPATDQMVIRKEMGECVREFISNLPPNYRTVMLLSEIAGMSNREIADILKISLDNVKVRRHRAKSKLKEALDDGCNFYHNEQNVLACDRKPSQILSEIPK